MAYARLLSYKHILRIFFNYVRAAIIAYRYKDVNLICIIFYTYLDLFCLIVVSRNALFCHFLSDLFYFYIILRSKGIEIGKKAV